MTAPLPVPMMAVRSWSGCAGVALLAVALSICFFSPRLWLMTREVPGSFQWSRAATYLLQCEQPLRRDIEPAMLWRLLPPLVAHGLQLPGKTPLVLPWLGILAATTYAARLLSRRCSDIRLVLGGSLLFTTTSAVLVPAGWLGMNDAWVWLGLLAVAFSPRAGTVAVACLLCPWIDERFIIGFPLAWLAGRIDRAEPLTLRAALPGLWLLPYAGLRLLLNRQDPAAGAATESFLHSQFKQSLQVLPLVPLGWWMGLRAAWVAVGYGLWSATPSPRLLSGVTLAATLTVSWLLASDLSRSAAITAPLVLAGCFAAVRREPVRAPRWVLTLGAVNLLIPAAHVVYTHVDFIHPLPVELFRLFR